MAQGTITYTLSAAGQRAALASNLDARADQAMVVPVVNGDLVLFDVARDGTLSADARQGHGRSYGGWSRCQFDTVPTADHLLSFLWLRTERRAQIIAEEQAAEATAKLQHEQEQAARVQATLDAIVLADAAGADAVPGHRVADTCIVSADGKVTFTESENQTVASICARHRAGREAAALRTTRIKALPDMPTDYPATISSPGVYAAEVPSSRYDDGWAKCVTSVNPSARGGYALVGEWVHSRVGVVPGAIIVVGSKAWEGSRRNGNYVYDVAVYVMTPVNLCRVWRGQSTDTAVSKCTELLGQSEDERVTAALSARIALCDKHLASLAAIDQAAYRNEMDEVTKRREAWGALRDRLQAALDGDAADDKIIDIDSAAAAIVAAGYRSLAQEHHPDHGGSNETMALLNEAKRQLRGLLSLAKEVQQ